MSGGRLEVDQDLDLGLLRLQRHEALLDEILQQDPGRDELVRHDGFRLEGREDLTKWTSRLKSFKR